MESVLSEESSSEVHTLFNIQYPTKHWSGRRPDGPPRYHNRRVACDVDIGDGFQGFRVILGLLSSKENGSTLDNPAGIFNLV